MFLEGGLSGLSHTWNSPDTGKCFSFKSLERMQHVDFWTYPRWTTWLKPVENHPALLSSGGGSPSWSSCIRGTSGQSAPASRSQVRPTKADWMNEAFVCRLNSFEAKSLKAPTICKPPTCPNKKKINPGHLLDLSKNRTYITPEHFGTTLWFAKGLLYWNCESWPPWGNIKDWEWLQIGDPEAWFFN